MLEFFVSVCGCETYTIYNNIVTFISYFQPYYWQLASIPFHRSSVITRKHVVLLLIFINIFIYQ